MQKWDVYERRYYPYYIPMDWNCKTSSGDFYEAVNCAACGREVYFGKCFISREIHDEQGYGYAVCRSCHEEELERRNFAELERRSL